MIKGNICLILIFSFTTIIPRISTICQATYLQTYTPSNDGYAFIKYGSNTIDHSVTVRTITSSFHRFRHWKSQDKVVSMCSRKHNIFYEKCCNGYDSVHS